MAFTIPMAAGIVLKFSTDPAGGKNYPTAGLQKGFLLLQDGQDLAEEGVGFGVPILKRGMQTIFPGASRLISIQEDAARQVTDVQMVYSMNLEERMVRPGFDSVRSKFLYAVKNFLADGIRRIPLLRPLLTAASNALRWLFGWQTTYEQSGTSTTVSVAYSFDRHAGTIQVEVDTAHLSGSGITEVVLMNEQGANAFDEFCDSDGIRLHGSQIGCWDKVTADWASFVSETHGLAFTLRQVKGAAIFRGRELVGSRLAWSGFGYSFPPSAAKSAIS